MARSKNIGPDDLKRMQDAIEAEDMASHAVQLAQHALNARKLEKQGILKEIWKSHGISRSAEEVNEDTGDIVPRKVGK
jgi:muconolactone delta-isomerase